MNLSENIKFELDNLIGIRKNIRASMVPSMIADMKDKYFRNIDTENKRVATIYHRIVEEDMDPVMDVEVMMPIVNKDNINIEEPYFLKDKLVYEKTLCGKVDDPNKVVELTVDINKYVQENNISAGETIWYQYVNENDLFIEAYVECI